MLQLVSVLLVALLCCAIKSMRVGFSVAAGGLALLVPAFLFTTLLFWFFDPHALKKLAIIFFVGEFVKLVVSAALLAVVIVCFTGGVLPALLGFVVAMFGAWVAPLFLNKPLGSMESAK